VTCGNLTALLALATFFRFSELSLYRRPKNRLLGNGKVGNGKLSGTDSTSTEPARSHRLIAPAQESLKLSAL